MPTNLNALIRYKTIDTCLGNPHRKWRMDDLVEACSKALSEGRGAGAGVSERTVREDIRVLRSDLLGFNAPIVQKEGCYSYADPSYSVFGVSVYREEVLKRILEAALNIQDEVKHQGLVNIIEILKDEIENGSETRKKVQENLDSDQPETSSLKLHLSSDEPRGLFDYSVGTASDEEESDEEDPSESDALLERSRKSKISKESYMELPRTPGYYSFKWAELLHIISLSD